LTAEAVELGRQVVANTLGRGDWVVLIAGQIGFRIDQHAGRKYSSHDLIL
jgi:hypothetical protein